MFHAGHCLRKGARHAEKKKKTKMTPLDFHCFPVHHFSNALEQSLCYCKDGATLESRLSIII